MNVQQTLELAVENHRSGKLSTAYQLYEEILKTEPQNADALHLLGVAAHFLGRPEEAIQKIQQAIRINPRVADFYLNLGTSYLALEKTDLALDAFNQSLELNPFSYEAQVNRGIALQQKACWSEAEAAFRSAIQIQPTRAEAYSNLGNNLKAQSHYEEAEKTFRQALLIHPEFAEAHMNLGVCYLDEGKWALARDCFTRSIEITPDSPQAHLNLGMAYLYLGNLQDSEACFDRAIQLKSDFAEAYFNRSLVHLTQGRWAEAWEDFEWRLSFGKRPFTLNRSLRKIFDRENLEGEVIELRTEQGFGDTFQFIRFVEKLRSRGAKVHLHTSKKLHRILKSSGCVDEFVEFEGSKESQKLVSIMSLPFLLRVRSERDLRPASPAYLFAEREIVTKWKTRLGETRSPRIGICWSSSGSTFESKRRAIPFETFKEISSRFPGFTFVGLQKEVQSNLGGLTNFIDLGEELDQGDDAFLDTAAVIHEMDLVISSDTSIAHLSGAMGKPTWVVLPKPADWRWLFNRIDSPWYPSMRLFQAVQSGSWKEPFEEITRELKLFFGNRNQKVSEG